MADEYPFPFFRFESPFHMVERSFNPVTADYEIVRYFSATIYVHDENPERTEAIFNDLVGILRTHAEEYGLRVFERPVWGPFEGSRYQTIFGVSEDHVLGGTFRERLEKLAEDVATGFKNLSEHGQAIIIVGDLAIVGAGGADKAAEKFEIPIEVTHAIVLGHASISALERLRKLAKKDANDKTG